MVNEGIEPTNFLNDLLEIIYFIQQRKNLGNFDSDLPISESEIKMIDVISKDVSVSTLILFWQFILKGLDELYIVSNPILSVEMLIIRLIHLKDMPSYENLLDLVNNDQQNDTTTNKQTINDGNIIEKKKLYEEKEIKRISKDQIKNTTQTKPELNSLNIHRSTDDNNLEKISSLEDLIKLSSRKRDIELKYDLEKNVNLIKFSNGKIDISFNENLEKNFVKKLSAKLLEWTGKRWLITLTKGPGQKTFSELSSIKKKELLEEEKKGEIYKKFKYIFSDAELIEILKKD